MTTTFSTLDLNTSHPVTFVNFPLDAVLRYLVPEARPSTTGFEFGVGLE